VEGSVTIEALLMLAFDYCCVQVINILIGRPIQRVAQWIAMYGEPRLNEPYRPQGYVEGGWR
jgi:hypothetical protein